MISVRNSVFLMLLALVESTNAVVDQTTHRTRTGRFRATYDASVEDGCEAVLMIGVGTKMGVTDYDVLAEKISAGQPIVTLFTDQSPGNPVKLDERRYARVYNEITENLDTYIPVCKGKSPKIIAGGHSASGRAALQAMMKEGVKPDGFIGLDPFQVQENSSRIPPVPGTEIDQDIPVLAWGFERQTCSVNPSIAGEGAYELAGHENRVFFRANNANANVRHCEFTNSGCIPVICGVNRNSNVKDVIAKSIQVFAASVVEGAVRTSDFQFDTSNNMVGIDVFVNSDVVQPASVATTAAFA